MPHFGLDRRRRTLAALLVPGALLATALAGVTAPSAAAATPCAVDDKLVNECRPWFGARVSGYPNTGDDLVSQYQDLERRVGRSLDVAHTFNGAGSVPFTEERAFLADRPDLKLYVNWKPDSSWARAGGSDAAVNARIDQAAQNVKAIAPAKIFLTLHHEPENDVTPGTSGCPGLKGTAGSPADYRAMWRNVRTRFDAAGATNVVWVMNYMNYPAWDCLVDEVWPGNDLVDWVAFAGYGSTSSLTWQDKVGRFYSLLERNSTAEHDYAAKPWAIAEYSFKGGTQPQAYAFYDSLRRSIEAGTYPKLKMYNVFDSPGAEADGSMRVAYSAKNKYDAVEQKHFNTVANLPIFLRNSQP